MIDKKALKRLSEYGNQDIHRVDLTDINDVKINSTLPLENRVASYLEQIKNPYYFICQGIQVKVIFKTGGEPFQIMLLNHLSNMKNADSI